MTDKFENIDSEEINLNNNAEIVLSDELTNAVAGGLSTEEDEDGFIGDNEINTRCVISKSFIQPT